MQTSWALPFLPDIKISRKRWPSGPIPLTQKCLEEFWGEEKRKETETKPETAENPLTGSAVNGTQFSIQVTHPRGTSKTGLEPVPSPPARAAGGGSSTLGPKGGPFYLTFSFLNHTSRHLSRVQFSKSAVQCAAYSCIHFPHLPCCTLFPF